jgi:GAF domain-containing protein
MTGTLASRPTSMPEVLSPTKAHSSEWASRMWRHDVRFGSNMGTATLGQAVSNAVIVSLFRSLTWANAALGADTSAILLLDRRSGQLVATAANGLEEEVRQGVRIPVGKGFAGRIAAQGRPVILDEVDHTKVINPILLEKGIRSLMGARCWLKVR